MMYNRRDVLGAIGTAGAVSVVGAGAVAAQEETEEEAPLCVATVQEETFTEAESGLGTTAPPMPNNIRYTTDTFTLPENAFEQLSLEGRRIVVRASWPNPANGLGLRLMQVGFGGQTQIGYKFDDGGELELVSVDGQEHVGPAPGVSAPGEGSQVKNEIVIEPGLSYELDIFSEPAPMLDFEFNIDVQAIERGC